jgi:hypothetical protein
MDQVEELILYVSSNNRVCPNPLEWDGVSRIIGAAQPGHKCVPLILAGWAFSSDEQKRDRVIEQIRFAHSLGEDIFSAFSKALYGLKEEEWCYGSEPLSKRQWDGM